MTISKTHHTLLLGAAALALDAVNAHGYCSRPAVTFPNGGDTTQFVATIDASASGLPGTFTGSPMDNAAAFWTAFKSSKFSSIKDLATSLGQVVAKGATLECGLTDPNGTPQPIPDELEWSHSGTEGFTASHEGPCEAWCDDVQVFQDENCAAHFTTAPAKMPYDKAKCSGASQFTFYWLALHSSTWQVYVNCAALEGGGDMYSTSQTEVNASESTEQSSPPTSSSDTPTAVVAPDQSYSFTGTTAVPSTTDIPVNTNKSTGESTTPTPANATVPTNATAPAEVVPTSMPAPTEKPSFTFVDANATPNTTEDVAPNLTKIIGSNTSETIAPSTPSTDPSNTPSTTIATSTTEVISPTGDSTTSSNSGDGSDVKSVGVVGIEDDCGSLDMAGEGDNTVKATTDITSSSNSGLGPDVNTVGVDETNATPNTTEDVAPNATKIVGSNTSETIAPSTPTTDLSNTPSTTIATPTTEVITPTGEITTSSNSGSGSDVSSVGVVSIEDDCGSLATAGEGDIRVDANTVPVPDEDCGSFDIAGSEDVEDCGSLDIAGGSLDGVGSSVIDNRITFDSIGSVAGEVVNPAISESSLNFDDVDRGYTGGKVQAPYQY